ncbi:gamma carbonic anhydrase family protein [Alteribacillus iranensis]|uniref:Carbonic anhydrase or acetyltransferase, isoleucine patch superfamily n=1 Tax=Alteribacillus iranensis TaxID=930128 RepID=A0A1I2BIM0_9BACI|nr:gamma carbonic anhydrase family protein [Alteribacillus iranensis]SFE55668.1 Carbonic anhydrase or acetyltransferase, isoleucine patch superfamily [Alteribacillus iranensis]
MIRHLKGRIPSIHSETYVDESAQVMGDVRLAKDVSIWPTAVLRGDDGNYIEVGEGSNVQDGSICHVTNEDPVIIGKKVTIGHGVILHACTIEDYALVGMGATVLDGAVVETGAQVAAGALVPPGKRIPKGSLAVGVPAKVVRELTEEEKKETVENANEYIELWKEDYQKDKLNMEG